MGTIGIEWVQKYNGLQGNLSNTKAQAEGFYNTLTATRQFTDGTARAEVSSARFGYLALPPTEPMPELSPVLELQGTLETEHQRYDFTRYVAAVEPGDRKATAR